MKFILTIVDAGDNPLCPDMQIDQIIPINTRVAHSETDIEAVVDRYMFMPIENKFYIIADTTRKWEETGKRDPDSYRE